MSDPLTEGLVYLQSQSASSLAALFWFVLLFETPRYLLSFIPAVFFANARPSNRKRPIGRISVVIAGHNEEKAIEACVKGFWEQSLKPDEIIVVSDGSTDAMRQKIGDLLKRGLIHKVHATDLRAGKAAAVNLAEYQMTGDILVNVDSDCSFDRHALKNIVAAFSNSDIGAVSGNILLRNQTRSVVCAFQAIEYLISISLGKRALNMMNQVTCASGAFGAFRRDALQQVGGLDAGGGEDLDVTIRLRKAGWKIAFADDAICYTDAPETLEALTRQRFRWERDAIRLRLRKHRHLINPFSPKFQLKECYHEAEFILFNIIGAVVIPAYFIWLFMTYGAMAPIILIAAHIGVAILDMLVFIIAATATPNARSLSLLPFVPGHSLFSTYIMRAIRLGAYLQEWLTRASYLDPYVPSKVHLVRR